MTVKSVAVVGTVGLPACYGGFESLVENLVNYRSANINYSVFCSSSSYQNKNAEYNGAQLIYLPLKANGLQSIFYDMLSLMKCLFLRPDVVLILGVSGCLFLPFFRLFSSARVICNIDGLEWRRDKWSALAKSFLKLSERVAVRFSHVVITDNQAITDYVTKEYGVTSHTIAYGGDHAVHVEGALNPDVGDYYLSVCRIEPENNVHMILESFMVSGLPLKFVGNWQANDYGRALVNKYGQAAHIELIEPIYDLERLYQLRFGCIGYLHGHSAGGTNPSLVEIMHFAKPIFCFDCDFNRNTTQSSAFFFNSSQSLSSLISTASLEERADSARKMKVIADVEYTWEIISKKYEDLF